MTRHDIETEIRAALTRLTEEEAAYIRTDQDLGTAIGLDSLGRLELLSEMEEQYDLTIHDIDSDRASTIGGMIDIVEVALAERS